MIHYRSVIFSRGKIESFFTIVAKHGVWAQCDSLLVETTSTPPAKIRGGTIALHPVQTASLTAIALAKLPTLVALEHLLTGIWHTARTQSSAEVGFIGV
jgi:hypothetical protein